MLSARGVIIIRQSLPVAVSGGVENTPGERMIARVAEILVKPVLNGRLSVFERILVVVLGGYRYWESLC